MGVRFEVFGGVRAIGAGGPIPLRPQVARVLGILLAEPGTAVPVGRIVDRLWQDHAPATAGKVVHVSVGQLRQALTDDPDGSGESGASLLDTTAAGYVLARGPDDLDEYERARARAEALRVTHPAEALAAATEARHLWRGRPWGDHADAAWLADRVTALEEAQRALVETWVDLLLDCGRNDDAVEASTDAVAAEPLRERRWAQMMTALYRSGRQADALAAYERVRRLLRDELGIEPGPELRRLELAVLQQDPVLLHASPARADVHAPTSFVGRVDELRALERAVDRDRMVTVTGIGGIGKTRLVSEYAHRRVLAGETVHRISFSGLEAPERFDDHVALELGLFLDERSALVPALAAQLGDRPALLVIDAADQVADRAGHLALALLQLCPRARVLATSRIALGLGGEREFRLTGLPRSEPDTPITGTDLELMLDRAGFDASTLDADTVEAWRATCADAGGIPLLIELTARTSALEPGGPATATAIDDEPVRAAIVQALDAVDDGACDLVTRCAVLPGGVTETLAAGIVGRDTAVTRRWLRQLAWVHLVDAFPGARAVRYRSLDPIRGAFRDDLDAVEREGAIRAATVATQSLVDAIWPDRSGGVVLDAIDRVADEHDNLRFLLADRLTHAPADALALAIGASDYWARRGHMVEGRAWLRDAVAAAHPEGPLRRRAALALCRATRTMAEVAQLRDELEAICTEPADDDDDDRVTLGFLWSFLAIARGWEGDRGGAVEALDATERIDRELGSEWSHANLAHLRAFDLALTGNLEAARAAQRAYSERMLELDDPVSAATGRYLAGALGDMMGNDAELPEVRADLVAARDLAEVTGDVSLSCQILLLEARVLQRANDASSRAMLVDAADRLAAQGGIRASALARRDIGLLALAEGERAEADEQLRAVAGVLLRLDRSAAAPACAGLAVLHAARGDHEIAEALAAAARSLPRPDAPQWTDDRTRVDEILGALATSGTVPAPSDDELLALLAT